MAKVIDKPLRRTIRPTLDASIQAGRVLLLYGPRRVGKTFLLREVEQDIQTTGKQVLFLNGESRVVQDNLTSRVPEQLRRYVGDADVVVVDEAQKVENIGEHLKLLVDTHPDIAVVASGSASFDLAQQVGEPLTGRKVTHTLFPISARELIDNNSVDYYLSVRDEHSIFGGYPALFSLISHAEKEAYLHELVDSYLLKDILEFGNVKGAKIIRDLLVLLAFQIGTEVSLTELGNSLDLSKDTVARYLDLLEKTFVIKNVRGFSRNLRKEVTKTSRYYFYDNGVRNALINNFNPLHLRDDVGMLWENYLVMERLKKQAYDGIYTNNYFWRTYDQKEIDWVEERGGMLHGYEFKWGNSKPKAPSGWLETYENAEFAVINQENFLSFIS